jgi:hypothetical protein
MLGALLCLMLVALTVPLRQFLAQRSLLSGLRARQAQQTRRIAALESLVARHGDPAYVEQLARERLHYARPGEVPFIVLTPPPVVKSKPGARGATASNTSWYATLWSSVQQAGAPEPTPTPHAATPAKKAPAVAKPKPAPSTT